MGSQALRYETTSNLAGFYGSQLALRFKDIKTPQNVFDEQNSVTVSDIKKLAKDIIKNENLNLSVVGPHKEEKFKDILKV